MIVYPDWTMDMNGKTFDYAGSKRESIVGNWPRAHCEKLLDQGRSRLATSGSWCSKVTDYFQYHGVVARTLAHRFCRFA